MGSQIWAFPPAHHGAVLFGFTLGQLPDGSTAYCNDGNCSNTYHDSQLRVGALPDSHFVPTTNASLSSIVASPPATPFQERGILVWSDDAVRRFVHENKPSTK